MTTAQFIAGSNESVIQCISNYIVRIVQFITNHIVTVILFINITHCIVTIVATAVRWRRASAAETLSHRDRYLPLMHPLPSKSLCLNDANLNIILAYCAVPPSHLWVGVLVEFEPSRETFPLISCLICEFPPPSTV